MCMFPAAANAKPLSSPPPIGQGKQRWLEPRASDLLFEPKARPLPEPKRRPKQAGDDARPPRDNFHGGAPLNDAPLSEWNLHPIVDFGVIRHDRRGSGDFGANRSRGEHSYSHEGIDIAVPPGTLVRAPADGAVEIFDPYRNTPNAGKLDAVQITTEDKRILQIMYVEPMDEVIRAGVVRAGQPIGRSQTLQQVHPPKDAGPITDHIHFQVERRWKPKGQPKDLVDPTEIARQWFYPPKH